MDMNAGGRPDHTPASPAPALRASDSDRERAVNELQRAVAAGMLSLAEFEERTGRALVAATLADLKALLADLPAARPAPGAMLLETGSGKLVREGAWLVPARLLLRCQSGVVKIDTTQAECHHSEVVLDIQCGSGQIRVTVPRHWTVRVESVRVHTGRVVDRTRPTDGSGPVLRVFADLGSGTLRLRHPRR
ncbi:DUF1707 domain-containing protein [Streptomyces sp. NPDC050560]|uniref:DUF1707 SHOCT-like domain-containing protein n=1 Tax=Streptomyces sp. NPDC050560 TaxID=3365630 RepID=UPI0037A86B7D